LGNLSPGDYQVDLKIDDAVAAVSNFKVVWPPDLENENQAIDSQRQKLLADSDAIQKLRDAITIGKLSVNQQDAAAVNAFNEKVVQYNTLIMNYNSEKAEFDARVQAFNTRISAAEAISP
jgi:hypothetical protein